MRRVFGFLLVGCGLKPAGLIGLRFCGFGARGSRTAYFLSVTGSVVQAHSNFLRCRLGLRKRKTETSSEDALDKAETGVPKIITPSLSGAYAPAHPTSMGVPFLAKQSLPEWWAR